MMLWALSNTPTIGLEQNRCRSVKDELSFICMSSLWPIHSHALVHYYTSFSKFETTMAVQPRGIKWKKLYFHRLGSVRYSCDLLHFP